jgi:hypothetical protein
MKISPNRAPILHGSGLQSVRKRIEAEFAKANNSGPTSLMPPKPVAETSHLSEVNVVETTAAKPRPPLVELAAPLLRVAENRYRATRLSHHKVEHLVTMPTETAEELFAAATRVVDAVCPQQKTAGRHEMEEE